MEGATIPDVWRGIEPIPISSLPAVARIQLQELAREGDVVLLPSELPGAAYEWDAFLRTRQLLGIRTTDLILKTLKELSKNPAELAVFLGSLGPEGGLILEAFIQSRTPGERWLFIYA